MERMGQSLAVKLAFYNYNNQLMLSLSNKTHKIIVQEIKKFMSFFRWCFQLTKLVLALKGIYLLIFQLIYKKKAENEKFV